MEALIMVYLGKVTIVLLVMLLAYVLALTFVAKRLLGNERSFLAIAYWVSFGTLTRMSHDDMIRKIAGD